jgi:single stranded DNA-binding protein
MLNKILLIGNLGRDPELNVTAEGTPVTKFSLAVNRTYKAKSGEKKKRPSGLTSLHGIRSQRHVSDTCTKARESTSKAA